MGADAEPPRFAREAVDTMHRSQWNSLDRMNIRITWTSNTTIPYTTHMGAEIRSVTEAVEASRETTAYR